MGVDTKKSASQPAPTDSDVGAGADMTATDLSRVTDRTDRTDGTDRTDKSYEVPEDGSPITIPTNRRRKDDDSSLSHDAHQSQTSLLIEYFEGGKDSQLSTRRPSVRVKVTPSSKSRSRSSHGHIQITKTRTGAEDSAKSGRRSSSQTYSKRIHLGKDRDRLVDLDGQSVSSYASQTEVSDISRNPRDVDVEVRPPRRHGSPLIPDPNSSVQGQVLGSDVSSMLPGNNGSSSYLGDSSVMSRDMRDKGKSKGYSKGDALIRGVTSGITQAAVRETLKPQRRRSRSLSRERRKDKEGRTEKVRTPKSEHSRKADDGTRSRSVSDTKKKSSSERHGSKYYDGGRTTSPRRASRSRHQEESMVSGISGVSGVTNDSSALSSKVYRSGTSAASKSSIGNPKLLEAVEDAIRRLILPELNAMRSESVKRDKYERERRLKEREGRSRRSSLTSATNSNLSTEPRDLDPKSKRTSTSTTVDERTRETGDRTPRKVSSGTGIKLQKRSDREVDRTASDSPGTPTKRMPGNFEKGYSEEAVTREGDGKRKTSGEKRSTLGAIGAAIGLGGLGYTVVKEHADSKESLEEREKADRRRIHARSRSRSDGGSLAEGHREERERIPRMPIMSGINDSELTRSSILSAETDRPISAGYEKTHTPIKEVSRGVVSPDQTPTKGSPFTSSRNLGTYHTNISTPSLSRTNLEQHQQEYELNDQGQKVPMQRDLDEARYENEYYEGEYQESKGKGVAAKLAGAAATVLAKAGIASATQHQPHQLHDNDYDSDEKEEEHNYYQNNQHVPAPLKYVPYNQEKRGLSPIQSVSGYTDADEQERLQKHRDSRTAQSVQSRASYSTMSASPRKRGDSLQSDVSDTRNYDFKEVRQGGLTGSEISADPDAAFYDEQHRINERNRDLDGLSYQSSDPRLNKHVSGFTENSANWQENSDLSQEQNLRDLGGKMGYVHTPNNAVESAVASLVDQSTLTGLTADSRDSRASAMSRSPALRQAHSYDSRLSELSMPKGPSPGGRRIASNASYDENSEDNFTVATPDPQNQMRMAGREEQMISDDPRYSLPSQQKQHPEYELDEQGRKITMPNYKTANAGPPIGNGVIEAGKRDEYFDTRNSLHTPGRGVEYETDEYGQKRPISAASTSQEHSRTSKNVAIAAVAGAGGYAAAHMMANRHEVPEPSKNDDYFSQEIYGENTIPGAPLQKSFKDRAVDYVPSSPQHSLDRFTEDSESVKLGASAFPNQHNDMPEFADDRSITPRISTQAPNDHYRRGSDEMDWERGDGYRTPTQGGRTPTPGTPTRNTPIISGRNGTPTSISRKPVGSASVSSVSDTQLRAGQMGLMDGFAMGAGAGPGAAAVGATGNHNRENSFDQSEGDWQRSSMDRKRDTIVTNPYEDSSPVTLLGGESDRNLLGQLGYDGVKQHSQSALNYGATSPGGLPKDEGYVSAVTHGPGGVTPEPGFRGVGFTDAAGIGPGEHENDPFNTPKHQRHMSGLSLGMDSPIYDSSTGAHREAIKSQDIVALMDHLTVRDAQRNARDTEILVTLVRAAAEMRTSFEDMKRLLADTEDQVITEVQRNTEKSIMKGLASQRPLPQSVKSLRSGTGEDDDMPTQRRNVFKRALKGLRMKSGTELAQIEGMLVQLLGDVEGLKVAQGIAGPPGSRGYDDYDSRSLQSLEQIGDNKQVGGYEPDGHAGTTTASHASQSGHFSNHTRGTSTPGDKFGGRKFSENRISTVQEDDEDDELDQREQAILDNAYDDNQGFTPVGETSRAESMPLPSPTGRGAASNFNNENTPKAEKMQKKHKATKSGGWNPLANISRWSKTTTSTVADKFRSSGSGPGKSGPASRTNSDLALGNYDHDPCGEDKLLSGYSQDNFGGAGGPVLTGGPARLMNDNNRMNASGPGADLDGAYSPQERPMTAESVGSAMSAGAMSPPTTSFGFNNQAPMSPVRIEDPKYKAHRNSLNLQHPQPRPGQQYQSQLEKEAIEFRNQRSPDSVNWGASQVSLPPNGNFANQRRYSAGTTGTDGSYGGQYGNDHQMSDGPQAAPARPPKEPLDGNNWQQATPKAQGRGGMSKPSPLVNNQPAYDDDDDETVSYDGSPRAATQQHARAVSGGQAMMAGAPMRKPTGPRQMGAPTRAGANVQAQQEAAAKERESDQFGGLLKRAYSWESESTAQPLKAADLKRRHSGESECF